MRPLTQAMIEKRCTESRDDWGPGVESTRIIPLSETRIKRQGISSEPLSSMAGTEGDLIKIPKSIM